MKKYPDSYYTACARGITDHAAHEGEHTAELCVIGGGLTGLSAAQKLAERGMNVVLLEAERIGFGASGRCGGLIGSGQSMDVLDADKMFGHAR